MSFQNAKRRDPRAIAITGFSGSGKTTLIVELIHQLVRAGTRVAAIKHTHHPLGDTDRGDTARVRDAGASPVILAGDGEAILFPATRIRYEAPEELLAWLDADVVLIEGFKGRGNWPRVEAASATVADVLDRIAGPMTPEPLRYRAVLFDLDGTLVDSYAALADAVNFARREHGLHDLSAARIRDFVGDGLERLLQRAFELTAIPTSVRVAFENRYDEICCGESKVLAEVEATLEELARLGVAMGVCTNKPTGFSKKILDFLGLSRHFRAIVGPDLAGARKPDPAHVLHTLDAIGCGIDGALFVGDMPIDVHAARNSGVDVAVIASGSSTAEQLVAARPDHYLDRFSDLVKVVRREAA